jgi:hypothetical protein
VLEAVKFRIFGAEITVTPSYTSVYLPTGLRTARLCDCVVQSPELRRKAVGSKYA